MASITRTDTGTGRRYVPVNYREHDGRQRRKTFHRKTDADMFASVIEADKARGAYVDVDSGRVTFPEVRNRLAECSDLQRNVT